MVTSTTTPTVNLSPSPSPNQSVQKFHDSLGVSFDSAVGNEQNVSADSLASYRQMAAIIEIESKNESDEDELIEHEPSRMLTRSGRVSQLPRWHANYAVLALTKSELGYYANLK